MPFKNAIFVNNIALEQVSVSQAKQTKVMRRP
jgi:hypothetical protein